MQYNESMKILTAYLVIVNFVAYCLMAADKRRAQKHGWRIPERTLFAAAILGGSLGAWVGMYLCHHKTKHWYFVLGIPLILVVQVVLLFWIGGKSYVV